MRPALKFYIILCLIAVGAWSCKSFEGGQVTVNPNPLEVHGDSVEFAVNVDVPPNSGIRKDITYTATPEIGNYKKFEPVTVDINEYPDAKEDGIEESFTFKVPYIPDEMQGNYLEIEHSYTKPNGNTEGLDDLDNLAKCCITTSELFMINSEFMFSHVNMMGVQPLKLVAQFNFPLDKWRLNESQMSEEDVQAILDFLEREGTARTIYLRGNASPEGPYDRNTFLAEKRAEVVREWLKGELEAAGYIAGENIEFEEEHNIEDWQGFEYKVRTSTLDQQTKDALIDIANSNASPEQKEEMLLDVLDGNVRTVEDQLSPLRKTTVVIESDNLLSQKEIDSIVLGYSEGDISKEELQEIFTREEWLGTAQQTYANQGEKSLLVAYYNVYPEDYRIYNDLAILSLVDEEETDWDEVSIKYDESDNQMKVKVGETKYKADDDETKYETEDTKVKIDRDDKEMKMKGENAAGTDYKVKMEDGDIKVKTDDMKMKYERDDNEFKYKSDDMTVKVEDGIMKVNMEGYEFKHEGVSAEQVASEFMMDYDQALNNLVKANQLKGDDYVVLSNLGAVWLAKRDYVKAKPYLIRSLEVRETSETHYNLGLVYALEGNYDKALEHFSKSDREPGMLYNIGLTKLLAEDYTGAESDLRSYVQAYPDEVWGYYLLAVVGSRTNNVDMMISNLEKVCEMDEDACDRAEDDLEFDDFKDTEAFEDTVD